ncbi:class I SAM-dependent methyltransferase [Streptosporangium longisporum]|uniref:Methyltransferase domain-containing protein n=1 Tax=Streptosporangium longisporum TaxID=46187 RepID=A0ABN3YAB1_9ACTN
MTVRQDNRFYGSLAPWWPLISPFEEYAEEAAGFAEILSGHERPVRSVLELGSGGGHNACHLKRHFAMTLTDLSEPMLEVSRRLNPECEHVCADMRTLRLDRRFDAVFVHDAVDYMTDENDLRAAIGTAALHCAKGGLALFVPDVTTETFEPGHDSGGSDGADGRAARYLSWTWDPDPSDSRILTEYAFILRHADKTVDTVNETHETGMFGRALWMEMLEEAGFDAEYRVEAGTGEYAPRDMFLGRRR